MQIWPTDKRELSMKYETHERYQSQLNNINIQVGFRTWDDLKQPGTTYSRYLAPDRPNDKQSLTLPLGGA